MNISISRSLLLTFFVAVVLSADRQAAGGLIVQDLSTQMIALSAGMSGSLPPFGLPGDGDGPEILYRAGEVPCGATGSSSTNWTGSGPLGAALVPALCDLPEEAMQAALPGEGGLVLLRGPPFEFLRPPRLV